MAPKHLSQIFGNTLEEIAKSYCVADLNDNSERAAFVSMIDSVLEDNPQNTIANALKGDLLCLNGQCAEALPYLRKAYDAGLRGHGVLHNTAEAMFQTDDFAAAEPLLLELADQYPKDFHITFMLAYTALKLGDEARSDTLFAVCIDNLEDLQDSFMPQIKDMLCAKYGKEPEQTLQPSADL